MTVAIVPAAGKSERFGSAKLLADLGGEPLVARTIRSLLSGGVDKLVLVVARGGPLVDVREPHEVFGAPAVSLVLNPDPDRGMFSSIQAGLAGDDSNADTILVLPADMPFVSPRTVDAIRAATAGRSEVVLPTCQDTHGHPIGLPGAFRRAVLEADPRSNLKAVLASAGATYRELPVDDDGVLRDVDRVTDLPESEGKGRGPVV